MLLDVRILLQTQKRDPIYRVEVVRNSEYTKKKERISACIDII